MKIMAISRRVCVRVLRTFCSTSSIIVQRTHRHDIHTHTCTQRRTLVHYLCLDICQASLLPVDIIKITTNPVSSGILSFTGIFISNARSFNHQKPLLNSIRLPSLSLSLPFSLSTLWPNARLVATCTQCNKFRQSSATFRAICINLLKLCFNIVWHETETERERERKGKGRDHSS